ncbi:hypothetical protein C8T65DRAFT_637294 [Cerioporus squamosus]|nr:hypothetical protein C8T65DRAFT_637294 [Cerioporus squamosus]
MAAALSQLSACVTRILSLTGFPKELKTRDIQAAFSEWDNVNGGFKIKWINDTSLLIVFNDATVAKRAYLHALAFPPSIFTSPNSSGTATIKPYDGPDAQEIIQSVNARTHNNSGRGHNVRNSVSHARGVSISHSYRNNNLSNGSAHANGNTLDQDPTANDPAVLAAQPDHGAPRIGDPGKRMLGAALGMRHPGLPPRMVGGAGNGVPEVQRAMAGLVVSE